jgi:hypothetical protein
MTVSFGQTELKSKQNSTSEKWRTYRIAALQLSVRWSDVVEKLFGWVQVIDFLGKCSGFPIFGAEYGSLACFRGKMFSDFTSQKPRLEFFNSIVGKPTYATGANPENLVQKAGILGALFLRKTNLKTRKRRP